MEDAITKQKDEAKACYEEILRKEMGTAEAGTEPADVTSEKELENTSEEMVEVRVGKESWKGEGVRVWNIENLK